MYRAGRFTCVKNISQKTKRNLTRKSFWIWMYTLQDPSVYTQWERDGWKLVPVLEGCFESSNCRCAHNTVFKGVPINYSFSEKWVFIKYTFPLDWLITLVFTVADFITMFVDTQFSKVFGLMCLLLWFGVKKSWLGIAGKYASRADLLSCRGVSSRFVWCCPGPGMSNQWWWTWLSGTVPFPVGQFPPANGDPILQHCIPRLIVGVPRTLFFSWFGAVFKFAF